MDRVRCLVLLVAFTLMARATTAGAQQQRATALVRREVPLRTTHVAVALRPHATAETGGASPGGYITLGAVIGALATAGGLALYAGHADDDVVMSPVALLPAVVGGAALGGGVGYVVYRARF